MTSRSEPTTDAAKCDARAAALPLPFSEDGDQVQNGLLAIAQEEGVDEVSQGLRVQGAAAPGDDQGAALAAPGGEQDHGLMHPIQCGLAHLLDGLLAPRRLVSADFCQLAEQVHLGGLFLASAGRRVGLLLAEEVLSAFGNRQQSGALAGDLDDMIQVFKMRTQALGNLARGVVFEDEAALGLGALALGFFFVVGLLLGIGVTAMVGQVFLTLAFSRGTATKISASRISPVVRSTIGIFFPE